MAVRPRLPYPIILQLLHALSFTPHPVCSYADGAMRRNWPVTNECSAKPSGSTSEPEISARKPRSCARTISHSPRIFSTPRAASADMFYIESKTAERGPAISRLVRNSKRFGGKLRN